MSTLHTPRKNYPYPSVDETLDGAEADFHNFANVKDLENEGQGDAMTAGVSLESDWVGFKGMTVVAATGVLEVTTNSGGPAWVPDPFVPGALLRGTSTSKAWSVTPSSLPASGKFMAIAVEVTAATWNEQLTAIAHSGVEKATQAEAEAAVPAVTSGYARVATAIVKNTGGTPKYIMAGVTDPEKAPTLSVTETFNRANENPFAFAGWGALGGYTKGKTVSNRWVAPTNGVVEGAYYSVAENANPFVSAEVVWSESSNQTWLLLACLKSTSWFYYAEWIQIGGLCSVKIYKAKTKNFSTESLWNEITLLKTCIAEGAPLNTGDSIGLGVHDGKVRAYYRSATAPNPSAAGAWMCIGEAADTSNTAGGYSGYLVEPKSTGEHSQLDNFTVGEVPSGAIFNPMVSGPTGAHSSQQCIVVPGGLEEDITISPTRPAYVLLTVGGRNTDLTVKVKVGGVNVFTEVKPGEAPDPPELLDSFLSTETPINKGGKWQKVQGAAFKGNAGNPNTGYQSNIAANEGFDGAYWSPTTYAASVVVKAEILHLGNSQVYAEGASLYACLSNPGEASRTGYQLQFEKIENVGGPYAVYIIRLNGAAETILGEIRNATLSVGEVIGLEVRSGGTIVAFKAASKTATPTTLVQVTDSNYTSGDVGVAARGGEFRIKNFEVHKPFATALPQYTTVGFAVPANASWRASYAGGEEVQSKYSYVLL